MALTLDTETITPAKAEEYLAKNHCNRPVSRTDVDRYKRLINEGLFEMTHQGIGLDARGRLRDGQNRLTAIVETGRTVKLVVAHGLTEKAIAAIDDGRKRSDRHALSMAFGEDVNTLKTAIAREMYSGALHVPHGARQLKPIRMDLLGFFEKNREAIDFAHDLLRNHSTGLSIGYVGAAIARAYYHVSKKKLTRFAELLANGFSSDEEEPLRKEEKFIIQLRNRIVKERERENHTAAQRDEIYGRVERAIQAYSKNEAEPNIIPAKKEIFRIEGDDEREGLVKQPLVEKAAAVGS